MPVKRDCANALLLFFIAVIPIAVPLPPTGNHLVCPLKCRSAVTTIPSIYGALEHQCKGCCHSLSSGCVDYTPSSAACAISTQNAPDANASGSACSLIVIWHMFDGTPCYESSSMLESCTAGRRACVRCSGSSTLITSRSRVPRAFSIATAHHRTSTWQRRHVLHTLCGVTDSSSPNLSQSSNLLQGMQEQQEHTKWATATVTQNRQAMSFAVQHQHKMASQDASCSEYPYVLHCRNVSADGCMRSLTLSIEDPVRYLPLRKCCRDCIQRLQAAGPHCICTVETC